MGQCFNVPEQVSHHTAIHIAMSPLYAEHWRLSARPLSRCVLAPVHYAMWNKQYGAVAPARDHHCRP